MVSWKLVYARQALKDAKKIAASGLMLRTRELLELLQRDPFENLPSYENLLGDLQGYYSRRINIQHRLVYQVFESEQTVRVLRMWSHYE